MSNSTFKDEYLRQVEEYWQRELDYPPHPPSAPRVETARGKNRGQLSVEQMEAKIAELEERNAELNQALFAASWHAHSIEHERDCALRAGHLIANPLVYPSGFKSAYEGRYEEWDVLVDAKKAF